MLIVVFWLFASVMLPIMYSMVRLIPKSGSSRFRLGQAFEANSAVDDRIGAVRADILFMQVMPELLGPLDRAQPSGFILL